MSTDLVQMDRNQAFELAQREAKAFAASSLVPETYRNNVPNVLVAMNMAKRLGADLFAVMQNLYVVKGRPAWSATFVIASVNQSGRFTPLRFETTGDDPHDKSFRCRAVARDKASDEQCYGEWITWPMVDAEKWGPKWQTMPGQMFRYRAAAFWARVYCPEVLMGYPTADEVEDYGGAAPATGAKALEAALEAVDVKPEPVGDELPLDAA